MQLSSYIITIMQVGLYLPGAPLQYYSARAKGYLKELIRK